MKAPAFLISGILSGKIVASGKKQKVRGAFADPEHDKPNRLVFDNRVASMERVHHCPI